MNISWVVLFLQCDITDFFCLQYLSTKMTQLLKWINGVTTTATPANLLLSSTMGGAFSILTGQDLSTLLAEPPITAKMANV